MEKKGNVSRVESEPLPQDQSEALQWLLALVSASDNNRLSELPPVEFRRGWFAIGFLYLGLHPDAALDHGTEISESGENIPEFLAGEPRLFTPYFIRSGWPVVLVPVAEEAWRRYRAGELSDPQFYCSNAVMAGIHYWNSAAAAPICWGRTPDDGSL